MYNMLTVIIGIYLICLTFCSHGSKRGKLLIIFFIKLGGGGGGGVCFHVH